MAVQFSDYVPDGVELLGVFDVEPMGKPRESRRDKWNPSPAVQRYRAQRDRIRLKLKKIGIKAIDFPRAGVHVVALIAPPKSWTKKKKRAHYFTLCEALPDCDNILKAFLDAVFYTEKQMTPDGLKDVDDRLIASAASSKIWVPKTLECIMLLQTPPTIPTAVSSYLQDLSDEKNVLS